MFMIQDLRVEDIANPIGLDDACPRFSWRFANIEGKRGLSQSAYRLTVWNDDSTVWDSGKVASAENAFIGYGGTDLQSQTTYFWRVRAWMDDVEIVSETARWTTGLIGQEEWNGASWIGADPKWEMPQWQVSEGYVNAKPLPLLRTEFDVSKPVRSAYAYICGLGHYELRFNGSKVGKDVIEPGWTHYNKSCFYKMYDLTGSLLKGSNAIGVMLGNGFYNVQREPGRYMKGGVERDQPVHNVVQDDPKLIMQVVIRYEDGTESRIFSNREWRVAPGPIVYGCIFGGEDYDARKEQAGWDEPGFQVSALWAEASLRPAPGGVLIAERIPSQKISTTFTPIKWTEPEPGVYVADLGQNFSGWFSITLDGGQPGSKVIVTPDELLNEHGLPMQELCPGQYYAYTKKGTGDEQWQPRFTYTGFRYVRIEGAVPLSLSDNNRDLPVITHFEGQVIAPDAPSAGTFECSNPMWNRIHEIIHWAMISNMKSVFTDCPHREKLGWLEEVHLVGPSMMYNYELPNLFRKSVADMAEAQRENGLVPDIAPEYAVFSEGFVDSPEWGSACVLVPWYLYNWYGDERILRQSYSMMVRYKEYLRGTADNGIVKHGLGDWGDVGPNPPYAQNTPVAVTATGFYHLVLRIMSHVSRLFGEHEESDLNEALAEEVRTAFHDAFYDPISGKYATGSQTATAIALTMGLVDSNMQTKVLNDLVEDVAFRGFHTTSGDVGHRFVLMALGDGNRSDVIARMLDQTESPSYGYQVMHGATALTEFWNGPTEGASQNHFMLGHIEEWFYRHLAGIKREYDGRGRSEGELTVAPYLAEGIQWVNASHVLPQGTLNVAWMLEEGNRLSLKLEIPPNAVACVHLPTNHAVEATEGGLTVSQAEGVTVVEKRERHLVMRVKSGRYHFMTAAF